MRTLIIDGEDEASLTPRASTFIIALILGTGDYMIETNEDNRDPVLGLETTADIEPEWEIFTMIDSTEVRVGPEW